MKEIEEQVYDVWVGSVTEIAQVVMEDIISQPQINYLHRTLYKRLQENNHIHVQVNHAIKILYMEWYYYKQWIKIRIVRFITNISLNSFLFLS